MKCAKFHGNTQMAAREKKTTDENATVTRHLMLGDWNMCRFFRVASVLSRGRTALMYLWPTLTSVCSYLISLSILIPLYAAGELANDDKDASASSTTPTAEAPAHRVPPNFSVAVGTKDQPQEMPAVRSAMTDYFSFSDEFASQLKQGAAAPDFVTSERQVTPETAHSQVEDGTAVLAVILPRNLTPTIISDIASYYRGEGEAPHYKVKILASPQSRENENFILRHYRDQVVRQASEHVSEQIRIVARKLDCSAESRSPCQRSRDDVEGAFETPFEVIVEEADGPTAMAYFSDPPDKDDPKTNKTSTESGNRQTTPLHHGSSISSKISAVFGAAIIAAVALAVTSSGVVNRAAGLQLLIIGPWRSMQPQRPFPRRMLLEQKYGMAVSGTGVLTAVASTSTTWIGKEVVEHLGTYASLRMMAVTGLLFLACLTVAITVLSVTDSAGGLFGGCLAVVASLWVVSGTIIDPGSRNLSTSAEMLLLAHSGAVTIPFLTVVALIFILATTFFSGLLITSIFDRKVSTQISRVDS